MRRTTTKTTPEPPDEIRWDNENERMPWPKDYAALQPFGRKTGVEFAVIVRPRRQTEGE